WLDDVLTAGIRPLALGAVLAGLLIAIICAANVMNLVVARGLYRQREYATRQALGASRADVLRLITYELAGIAAATIASSVLVSRVAIAGIAKLIPAAYTAVGAPVVGSRVATFAALLTVTVLIACAVPACLSARAASTAAVSRARQDEPRGARRWRF